VPLVGQLLPPKRRAATVITVRRGPYTRLGDCWRMAGDGGFITFELHPGVLPNATTEDSLRLVKLAVEYAPELIRYDHLSAPRELRLWARNETHEISMNTVKPEDLPKLGSTTVSKWKRSRAERVKIEPIKSETFTYAVAGGQPALQSWLLEVPEELEQVDGVRLEVVNNWGNDDYTSIYRVQLTVAEQS